MKSNVENRIKALLSASQRVYYLAVPIYGGTNPYVPSSIDILYGRGSSGLKEVEIQNLRP
jgi:hypothetical protein